MVKVTKVPGRNWLVVDDERQIPIDVLGRFDVVVQRRPDASLLILKDRRVELSWKSPESLRAEIEAAWPSAIALGGEPVSSEQILRALDVDPSAPAPMSELDALRRELEIQKNRSDSWAASERRTRGLLAEAEEKLKTATERGDRLARENAAIYGQIAADAQEIHKALGLGDFSTKDPKRAVVDMANELRERHAEEVRINAALIEAGVELGSTLAGEVEQLAKMYREAKANEAEYKLLRESVGESISDPERAYWHAYARARFGGGEGFDVSAYAPEVWRVVAHAVNDAQNTTMRPRDYLARLFKGEE